MLECSFCQRICKNANSFRNHERLCKLNPERQIPNNGFLEYNSFRKEFGIKGSNQFTKAKKTGQPVPSVSEEVRKKISNSCKGRSFSLERRQRHSEAMKKAVETFPDSYTKSNVCGRVKSIEYNGYLLKGSWEVLVAKWLDLNKISWRYETVAFTYEWNGIRKYYPDFYLPDLDIYLEVKGFVRDRDLVKWSSVSNLVVFKHREIKAIRQNTLTLAVFLM